MAGDFSRRSTYNPRGYASVLMQQGRVQLDADWNEQSALLEHRINAETRDTVGACGTPEGKGGFRLELTPAGDDFFINPGRYYANGLLCEINPEWVDVTLSQTGLTYIAAAATTWLDGRPLKTGDWVELGSPAKQKFQRARVGTIAQDGTFGLDSSVAAYQSLPGLRFRRVLTYLTQPFYPWPDPSPGIDSPPTSPLSSPLQDEGVQLADGEYLAYLEAWQREVDALEDPHIREVALGGPDTSERLQAVWQVRLAHVSDTAGSPPQPKGPCAAESAADESAWNDITSAAATTGLMNARSVPPTQDTNPCILPPSAGFQGLENQLYRIEIFRAASTRAGATIVWSRDNATVETSIVSVDAVNTNVITVSDLGKDDLHSFGIGDWVEISDRDGELQGAPRFLAQIVAPAPDPSTNAITLSSAVPNPGGINDPGQNVFRLRRWDMTGSGVTSGGIPIVAGWMPIEAGVQVSFDEGTYAPRAFWMVPARTATADVEWPPFQSPNTNPVPQPPVGEIHAFCKLAQLSVVYGSVTVYDLRVQFASLATLTNLYANLRFHKKMLHGCGIVCGLDVQCTGNGTSVRISDGYAIDCNGEDILFCNPRNFDVIAHITTPSGVADGDYSLFIDAANGNTLGIEPLTSKDTLADAFKNTVWVDFSEQYLKPFQNLWKEYATQPADQIVKNQQRALSSLVNLFYQAFNGTAGSEVFISRDEDAILRKLYEEIRAILKSKTFCALLSNMRPVPEYPASISEMRSGFGKGFKSRLRMNTDGTAALATGNNNEIHLYTFEGAVPVLNRVITFPGSSSLVVEDAVFAVEGPQFYAIANDGTNSTFAALTLDGTASPSLSVPSVVLKTLVVQAGNILATGVSKGLYSFTQVNAGSFTVTQILAFNATGQMVDGGAGAVFAAANSTQSVVGQTNEILLIRAATAVGGALIAATFAFPQGVSGGVDDDLAVVLSPSPGNQPQRVLVTANSGSTRTLLVNYSMGGVEDTGQWAQAALGGDTIVRFAWTGSQMLMSFGTSNVFAAISESVTPGTTLRQVSWTTIFPSEITPVSLAVSRKQNGIYALNLVSDTITAIPLEQKPWSATQTSALRRYRAEMLDAWYDLIGALLQYLKDGFCDLLVLKCRACCPDANVIYLAGITVTGGKVHKTCNFSKRHYVKTFPGVEYWLSLIPVLPVIEYALREFCCITFTDLFANITAPQPSEAKARINLDLSVSQLHSVTSRLKSFNITSLKTTLASKVASVSPALGDYLGNAFKAPPVSGVDTGGVVGQPVDKLQHALQQSNVAVTVQPYDPGDLAFNLSNALQTPDTIPPGSAVTLLTDSSGNVRSFYVAPPQISALSSQITEVQKEQAQMQPDAAATASLKTDVANLKTQIANLQAQHTQELASRDQQIAQLTAASQQLQSSLTDLRTQFTKLTPPPTPPKIG